MSVLEFIRKNSIFVLIVIAGVGVGLVMMDYGDKGSQLRRDFYVQVNGTGYSYPETTNMGEQGEYILSQLSNQTQTKLRNQFDTNQDDTLNETEAAAMQAYLGEHPEISSFLDFTRSLLQNWCYGYAKHAEVNIAVNRIVLHEEAAALGISPSKEQIDAYIQAMPAFRNADGSFDQPLYQRMAGYYKGAANNAQEKAFRSVVSDMMVWECLSNLLTDGVRCQSKTTSDLVDMHVQKMSGKTAWLPAAAAPAPAVPTEEELKAYWEEHKEAYKSATRRIVSLYTLTPGEGSSIDALLLTSDALMQDLSQANGKGFDELVQAAAENPEFEPFNYQTAEGAVHTTFPLSTESEAAPALQTEVTYNGKTATLAEIAFRDVESAPTVEQYEQAVKNGTAEQLPKLTQIRGYYHTADNKVYFLRVEAEIAPAVLPFEEAREAALADLNKERADHALDIAAHELFDAMEKALAEGGVDAAFAKAAEAKAEVSDFGPLSVGFETAELPQGMEPQALLSVHSGKMAPLVVQQDGARFTAVTERTIEESPEYAAMKAFSLIPMQNAQLRGSVLLEWMNEAYGRYKVTLSKNVEHAGN